MYYNKEPTKKEQNHILLRAVSSPMFVRRLAAFLVRPSETKYHSGTKNQPL